MSRLDDIVEEAKDLGKPWTLVITPTQTEIEALLDLSTPGHLKMFVGSGQTVDEAIEDLWDDLTS